MTQRTLCFALSLLWLVQVHEGFNPYVLMRSWRYYRQAQLKGHRTYTGV